MYVGSPRNVVVSPVISVPVLPYTSRVPVPRYVSSTLVRLGLGLSCCGYPGGTPDSCRDTSRRHELLFKILVVRNDNVILVLASLHGFCIKGLDRGLVRFGTRISGWTCAWTDPGLRGGMYHPPVTDRLGQFTRERWTTGCRKTKYCRSDGRFPL